MKKNGIGIAVDSVDRRTCLKSLGALAFTGIPNVMPASSKREYPDLPAGVSDIGTLFPAVMELANQCHYPLSWLERDYSSPVAYRHAVREKVFELFHYAPSQVVLSPELVERWETPEYVQEKILFSSTPWFRVP